MKPWVAVPFSRPECLQRLQQNLQRQRFRGFRVCVVENGRAKGFCKERGFEPDLLLQSKRHPSWARNTALEELRRDSDNYVLFMDDDDVYGPRYVEEHLEIGKPEQLVGKFPHWVHFEGKCLALFRPERQHQLVSWVCGPTIAGYAREFPEFPDIPLGEEIAVCSEFWKQGGKVFNSSFAHFLCIRREDAMSHTFSVTQQGFASRLGPWFYSFPESQTDHAFDEFADPQAGKRICRL